MSYVHHVPGRLRVRAAGVKRHPDRARSLQQWLETIPGVERAEVNPLTGSALIYYRLSETDPDCLMALMRYHRWITEPTAEKAHTALPPAMVRFVLQSLAQIALERSVLALSAALL